MRRLPPSVATPSPSLPAYLSNDVCTELHGLHVVEDGRGHRHADRVVPPFGRLLRLRRRQVRRLVRHALLPLVVLLLLLRRLSVLLPGWLLLLLLWPLVLPGSLFFGGELRLAIFVLRWTSLERLLVLAGGRGRRLTPIAIPVCLLLLHKSSWAGPIRRWPWRRTATMLLHQAYMYRRVSTWRIRITSVFTLYSGHSFIPVLAHVAS